MRFENVNIYGLNIFYREAGDETAPKLVLLHGFSASSHQYRPTVVLHIKRVVGQAEILGGSDGARTHDLRRDTPVEQALAPRQRRCTIP